MSSWENISFPRIISHKDVIFIICKYQYNLFSIFGLETFGIVDGEIKVVKNTINMLNYFNTVCY